MPIQILPPDNPSWGTILGTGLGQGINSLVQNKLGEINQAKQAKAWESIGLPSNYANFMVSQPEWVQKEFLSRLEGLGDVSQDSPMQMQGSMQPQVQQQQMQQPKVKLGLSQEEKKRRHEDQKLINKEVYPFIKDVQHKAKGARENQTRLDRMEALIGTGKLNNPAFASALKTIKHGIFGIGLDLEGLLSSESQEFNKLSGDFVKNAKDVFGNRITDTDLKAFLATIPNLSQTNEGKLKVIRNLKLMNKAAELREQAARQLLKHYNNKPPLDFEAQVDELIKPQLDAISSEFQKGSSIKTSKTSSLPGDVVGGLGQVLLGNQ